MKAPLLKFHLCRPLCAVTRHEPASSIPFPTHLSFLPLTGRMWCYIEYQKSCQRTAGSSLLRKCHVNMVCLLKFDLVNVVAPNTARSCCEITARIRHNKGWHAKPNVAREFGIKSEHTFNVHVAQMFEAVPDRSEQQCLTVSRQLFGRFTLIAALRFWRLLGLVTNAMHGRPVCWHCQRGSCFGCHWYIWHYSPHFAK